MAMVQLMHLPGLLFLRYLFGLSGNALIAAFRLDISQYIDSQTKQMTSSIQLARRLLDQTILNQKILVPNWILSAPMRMKTTGFAQRNLSLV